MTEIACFTASQTQTIPLHFVETAAYSTWLSLQSPFVQRYLSEVGFTAAEETYWLVPNAQGQIQLAVAGVKSLDAFWMAGGFAKALPPGNYLLCGLTFKQAYQACCAWGLGAYQFLRYKSSPKPNRTYLIWPSEVDQAAVLAFLKAIYCVRDLINTPTEDMSPEDLAQACEAQLSPFGAKTKCIVGEALLSQGYPAIHAVGRGSSVPPRLIDITWGDPAHPKLTLVGKGVCFDTGGLNIKTGNYMNLMKKDMGGAAHALGLALLIVQAKLPVRLRLLIPAVENAISGNAYRPGDVIPTRKGLSVEVTNTDAEGRLILADALCEAASEQPDLLIDLATLTGAARVALGPDIPVYFTPDETLARSLNEASLVTQECLWRLPLYEGYRKQLDSAIADLNNSPSSSYGGAIAAALFLQAFVPPTLSWLHFDLMAWNLTSKSGRPEGGEAMGLRALWHYLSSRYPREGI